ncbi:hypothetical protein AMTRI_Chr05g73850 [Amborella trichopoda]
MDSTKDQASGSAQSMKSRLRYPLRSAGKAKEDKSQADIKVSSATKREKPVSNVSKSVSVLDFSVKEKTTKPPRRLSVPSKSIASPLSKLGGGITPISETRAKKTATNQGKGDTPASDASKSIARKKFNVLSSHSYWVSQIKLSESASKHSISLGFFKLALDAGCEPLHRMQDELKLYIQRHNLLTDLGELTKDVLQLYEVSENLVQSPSSETSSLVQEDDSHSITDGNLKPKSLNIEPMENNSGTESASAKKDAIGKRNASVKSNRSSFVRSSANLRASTDTHSQKTSQRTTRRDLARDKNKGSAKKETVDKASADPVMSLVPQGEDKENLDSVQMEDSSLTAVQA